MKTSKLFLMHTHVAHPKAGEPAEIIGTEMATCKVPIKQGSTVIIPGEDKLVPCFKLQYSDGSEYHEPIFDTLNADKKDPFIELISEEDFEAGNFPKIAKGSYPIIK